MGRIVGNWSGGGGEVQDTLPHNIGTSLLSRCATTGDNMSSCCFFAQLRALDSPLVSKINTKLLLFIFFRRK